MTARGRMESPPKTLLDAMDCAGWEYDPHAGPPGWVWRRLARGWLTAARLMAAVHPPYEWRIEFGWLPFTPADCFLCKNLGDLAEVLQQRNLIWED